MDQLVGYTDMTEAVKWARFYKIPDEDLPYQVIDAMKTIGE